MEDTTSLVKQATDIVALVGEYVQLDRAGKKYKGICPFHPDHKPSLEVDPDFQSFVCWPCGAKGDVFTFLQKIERIDFVEAKRRLAERAGVALGGDRSGSVDSRQAIFRALAWAQKTFQEWLFDDRGGAPARAYLRDRGLSEATAREHGLGFSPPEFQWLLQRSNRERIAPDTLLAAGLVKRNDRGSVYDAFRGRLLFPIRDDRRRVLGFGGRIIPSAAPAQSAAAQAEGPKYLNSPATDVYNKSEVLYGLDVAKDSLLSVRENRTLVLMEGYTDCLMAYQHGMKNAVATCGTALTLQHLRRLRQYADTVVLMFDGDAAGQRAAHRALELFLQSDLRLRLAVLPRGMDPCDFLREHGTAELQHYVDDAPDALTFALESVKTRHNLATAEGKLEAQEELALVLASVPILGSAEQKIRFDVVASTLVSALGTEERTLRRRIDELRRKERRAPAQGGASTATQPEGGVKEGLDADPPPNNPERQAVQWLASRPGYVAPRLQGVFPAAEVRHPRLRRLAEAAYRLFEERGETATTDQLREVLNDPALDSYVMDLTADVPKVEEQFAEGLAAIVATLGAERRRLQTRSAKAGLPANADEDDHLEWLRRYRPRPEAQ